MYALQKLKYVTLCSLAIVIMSSCEKINMSPNSFEETIDSKIHLQQAITKLFEAGKKYGPDLKQAINTDLYLSTLNTPISLNQLELNQVKALNGIYKEDFINEIKALKNNLEFSFKSEFGESSLKSQSAIKLAVETLIAETPALFTDAILPFDQFEAVPLKIKRKRKQTCIQLYNDCIIENITSSIWGLIQCDANANTGNSMPIDGAQIEGNLELGLCFNSLLTMYDVDIYDCIYAYEACVNGG